MLPLAALTFIVTLPVKLMLPANSWSPWFFSSGKLSPVKALASTSVLPSCKIPSRGILSPALTLTRLFTLISATGIDCHCSSTKVKAVLGVRANNSARLALAFSTVRSSSLLARVNSTITIAASDHWPIIKAPVTATVIKEFTFKRLFIMEFQPSL